MDDRFQASSSSDQMTEMSELFARMIRLMPTTGSDVSGLSNARRADRRNGSLLSDPVLSDHARHLDAPP